jgi:hypothetical protein
MRDDQGFTSAGMAVALLLTLSLLFTSAQVYRINSAAAEIQEVADAAALAAESQVGEYMIAARIVDATLLSMTLAGDLVYGVGVVALCVPPVAAWGSELISLGKKVFDARDTFAKKATEGLDAYQKVLPFLAAAQGAEVANANGTSARSYYALALLLPTSGSVKASLGQSAAEEDLVEAADAEEGVLKQAAAEAEEAMKEAQEAKERGFKHDCGNVPAYCMAERASTLAGLTGAQNPTFTSVDAWSFSVALDRARTYYRERLLNERSEGDTVKDQARSALRKHFYTHAVKQLRSAYVRETEGSFEANFPRFPRNTDEMRQTDLYTEAVYPVTLDDGSLSMHAWDGCPEASVVEFYESVKVAEEGNYSLCPSCEFSAKSLGSVASASTSIDNGFEYHYAAVAQAADDYQKALEKSEPAKKAAQKTAQSLFDKLAEALKELQANRLEVKPPGSSGCLALVVSPQTTNISGFSSVFTSEATLNASVALSGTTLLEDTTEDSSVVSGIMTNLLPESGLAGGAASLLLNCWSGALKAYEGGQRALLTGIEETLNGLPLIGATGLGSWAANSLRGLIETLGLEPAKTYALKPVLVNTSAVAQAVGGDYAKTFLKLKAQVRANPEASGDAISLLGTALSTEVFKKLNGKEIVIAQIALPGMDMSWPIKVAIPQSVAQGVAGLVDSAVAMVRKFTGLASNMVVWE